MNNPEEIKLPIPKKITKHTNITGSMITDIIESVDVKALKQIVQKQPEKFNPKQNGHDYIQDIIDFTTENEKGTKHLQTILKNNNTATFVTSDHISQIIQKGNTDVLNAALDNKEVHKQITPEHAHEAIKAGKIDITKALLREAPSKQYKVFNAEHINTAIDNNQTDALTYLINTNIHNTKKLLTNEHATSAIAQYTTGNEDNSKNNTTLEVILNSNPKILTKPLTTGGDAIDFAISQKHEAGFSKINAQHPELIKPQHALTAIKSSNVRAFSEILNNKPEIIKQQHLHDAITNRETLMVSAIIDTKPELLNKKNVTEAAKTGNVDIINKVFEKALDKTNQKINKSKVRDQALFSIVSYIESGTASNAEKQGLLELASNLMAAGASSKTKLTRESNGLKTSAQSILQRLTEKDSDNPLLKKVSEQSNAQKKKGIFSKGIKAQSYISTSPQPTSLDAKEAEYASIDELRPELDRLTKVGIEKQGSEQHDSPPPINKVATDQGIDDSGYLIPSSLVRQKVDTVVEQNQEPLYATIDEIQQNKQTGKNNNIYDTPKSTQDKQTGKNNNTYDTPKHTHRNSGQKSSAESISAPLHDTTQHPKSEVAKIKTQTDKIQSSKQKLPTFSTFSMPQSTSATDSHAPDNTPKATGQTSAKSR